MKKVLMIAYNFPPMGGPGVQRTVNYVKHLPAFGWNPCILTVRNKNGFGYDPTLLSEIANPINIYRTSSWEPINIYQKSLRFIRVKRNNTNLISERTRPQNKASTSNLIGVLEKVLSIIKSIVKTYIFIPDDQIAWLPVALWKGLSITKKDHIDTIYTTSDPYTTHLIGCLLKKITGKPWVADFRDAWTQHPCYEHSSKYRKKIDGLLEQIVLSNADRVISAAKPISENFVSKYPHIKRNRFLTITNGFDSDDFKGVCGRKSAKFTITYTGNFRLQHTPKNFLKALRELINEQSHLSGKIVVNFVGLFGDENEELVKRLHLDDVVNIVGYISHKECIQYLMDADVLLLLIFDSKGSDVYYTGKLFEYIAARKPILALVPEGIAGDLIRRGKFGTVVPPKDIAAIKREILRLYVEYRKGGLFLETDFPIEQFERKKLTGKLASVLNEIAEP